MPEVGKEEHLQERTALKCSDALANDNSAREMPATTGNFVYLRPDQEVVIDLPNKQKTRCKPVALSVLKLVPNNPETDDIPKIAQNNI